MRKYQDRIVTEYERLPTCSPDFIYLDGPGRFKVKKVNGITTVHKDMMPTLSDLLKIKYFLTQETMIIVDGRDANSNFLKDYFKRK
tara:strand:- start:453 stop:710 length:258 start_codon:yes stop_codon:yes gene_type:complete